MKVSKFHGLGIRQKCAFSINYSDIALVADIANIATIFNIGKLYDYKTPIIILLPRTFAAMRGLGKGA